MMRRIIFSLMGLILTFTDAALASREDEAIQNVIRQLSAVMLINGQFEQQKQLQGLDYPLTSSGHFIFWKEKGLYLASEKPFFNASTITPTDIIQWQEDGTGRISEEQSGLIQREISRTLLAIFRADIKLIGGRSATRWRFEGERWQLVLPARHDLVREHMHLAELLGVQYIESLQIIGCNGDLTRLVFTHITSSAAPTPEQCRWFYL